MYACSPPQAMQSQAQSRRNSDHRIHATKFFSGTCTIYIPHTFCGVKEEIEGASVCRRVKDRVVILFYFEVSHLAPTIYAYRISRDQIS
jgi:hypothetical protein